MTETRPKSGHPSVMRSFLVPTALRLFIASTLLPFRGKFVSNGVFSLYYFSIIARYCLAYRELPELDSRVGKSCDFA